MTTNDTEARQAEQAAEPLALRLNNQLGHLVKAAETHAAAYDGDDREQIKTDVLNAFYAGASYGMAAERERCSAAVSALRRRLRGSAKQVAAETEMLIERGA